MEADSHDTTSHPDSRKTILYPCPSCKLYFSRLATHYALCEQRSDKGENEDENEFPVLDISIQPHGKLSIEDPGKPKSPLDPHDHRRSNRNKERIVNDASEDDCSVGSNGSRLPFPNCFSNNIASEYNIDDRKTSVIDDHDSQGEHTLPPSIDKESHNKPVYRDILEIDLDDERYSTTFSLQELLLY